MYYVHSPFTGFSALKSTHNRVDGHFEHLTDFLDFLAANS